TVVVSFAAVWQSREQALRLAEEKGTLASEKGALAAEKETLANSNARLAAEEQKQRRRAERESALMALQQAVAPDGQGNVGRAMLLLAHSVDLAGKAGAADLERAARRNLALWRGRLHGLKALLPHEGEVLAVAFSPDGRKLMTGAADKKARVWDVATGQ